MEPSRVWIAKTRECRKCGEEMADEARYCSRCGHKMAPEEGVAAYEYVPVQPFTECPRCGQEHESEVLSCSRCEVAVDVELMNAIRQNEERRRPLFDWQRGIRQGLIGYVIFQGLMVAVSGMPDLAKQWPTYLIFAILWTVVSALGVDAGPTYGLMLGIMGLQWLLMGWLGPITSVWGLLNLHLIALFIVSLGLTLFGLARGRLEVLRLYGRLAVSRLFGLAAFFLLTSFLVSSLAGPRMARGEIRFEAESVVSEQRFQLNSSRMIFKEGETVAWVATLKRPVKTGSLTLVIAQVDDADKEQLILERDRVTQDGTVKVIQGIPTQGLTPGWYVVRLSEGGSVLAEGRFLLQAAVY